MRTMLTVLACLVLLPATADGQAIQQWERQLREMDPDTAVILDVERGTTSEWADVTVTDGWYNLRCYQRKRFAKSMLGMWRKVTGSSTALVALEDRYGERVAEPGWLGGMEVEGCD